MAGILKKSAVFWGRYSRPEVIIVGAQKAGTTAMFNGFSKHPQMVSSDGKELHYFDNDEVYSVYNHAAYHENFPLRSATKNKVVFECTPSYLYHPYCAQRIAMYRPDMKIIIMLREPASRALSAWNMYHNFKNNPTHKGWYDERSFAEAVAQELPDIENTHWYTDKIAYVRRGVYVDQVQAYLDKFPAEQIHFMENKDLRNDFDATAQKLAAFLNVDASGFQPTTANTGKPYDISDFSETIEKLKAFYKPFNEALFELTGTSYDW